MSWRFYFGLAFVSTPGCFAAMTVAADHHASWWGYALIAATVQAGFLILPLNEARLAD